MTNVSKKLEQLVRKTISNSPIIPAKVDGGIQVGSVLIVSKDNLKNLWKNNTLIYAGVNLNAAAIKLANELAKYGNTQKNNELYLTDQEYGRWLNDSQIHYKNYHRALAKSQHDRADMIWARYCESRDRCNDTKRRVERLSIL
jgi:hypothetical protein